MRDGGIRSAAATSTASSDGRYRPRTRMASAACRMAPSASGSALKDPHEPAAAAIGGSGEGGPGDSLVQGLHSGAGLSGPPESPGGDPGGGDRGAPAPR